MTHTLLLFIKKEFFFTKNLPNVTIGKSPISFIYQVNFTYSPIIDCDQFPCPSQISISILIRSSTSRDNLLIPLCRCERLSFELLFRSLG